MSATSRLYSASLPSHQWTWSGCVSAATSCTQSLSAASRLPGAGRACARGTAFIDVLPEAGKRRKLRCNCNSLCAEKTAALAAARHNAMTALSVARAAIGFEQAQQPRLLRQHQAHADAHGGRQRGIAREQPVELARHFIQPPPTLPECVRAQGRRKQQQATILGLEWIGQVVAHTRSPA